MATEHMTFSTRRFLVGKAGPFPRLVFREEVMLALDQFSHLHTQGEHGGFLIGRKQELKTAEHYEITVERFVPIPQRSDASRLVIHQDHLRTVQLALKTGEGIVGWVHTHPGFGVFLSSFDKEQHQRYFPKPWQIAYVIDNQTLERAVYHLVADEWRRLEGYYVLRDMTAYEVGVTSQKRPSPWLRVAVTAMVVLLLIGGASVGYPILRDLLVSPQDSDSVRQTVSVKPSGDQSSQPVVPNTTVTTVPESTAPKPAPEAIPSAVTIAPPSTVPRYVEYVVVRGDTLWSIADKLWGDPSLFRLIAEENDISQPSSLQVGMVLRVPANPR